jgi:hypothetical protein
VSAILTAQIRNTIDTTFSRAAIEQSRPERVLSLAYAGYEVDIGQMFKFKPRGLED